MTRHRAPDINAILEGRTRPSIEDLFRLIKQVNPSDRGLPRAQEARDYARKSALQSLLIRHFGEQLTPEPDGEGIVLLRHRLSGHDAAHALVAELDEEARLWVRRRLVEQELPPEPPATLAAPRGAPRSSPDRDDYAAGIEALEAYDYEGAQQAFEAALTQPATERAAARALVELLVDHLVQDAEALALSERLPRHLREDPEVRSVLAVAAARMGSVELARRWGAGAGDGRRAELHAALAETALRSRDLGAAERQILDLEALDPAFPSLLTLQRRLADLRATARQPAEAELQALLAQGEWEAAAAKARAILEDWPGSQVARAGIRTAEAPLRARERAERLVTAERALEAEDWSTVRSLLEGREEGDPQWAALQLRLEAAQDRTARAEAEARVDRSVERLRTTPMVETLVAWAALPSELRARVKARVEAPILDWMEACPGFRRRPEDAAQAVLALRGAVEQKDADPEALLRVVEAHGRELRGLKEVRQLEGAARGRVESRLRARWEALLDKAEQLLADGDPGAVLALTEEAGAPTDPTQAALLARSREVATVAVARQRRLDALKQARASGDLTTAWGLARELAEADPSEEPLHQELHQALLRAWAFERVDGDLLLRDAQPLNTEYGCPQLDPTGEVLLHAVADGRWLFLREVDTRSGRCRRGVSLHTPAGFQLPSVSWEGGGWRLAGAGHLLDLDPTSLEPRAWWDLSWFHGDTSRIDLLLPTGDPRFVWAQRSRALDFAHYPLQIIDLHQRKRVRTVDGPYTARALVGPSGPMMVGFLLEEAMMTCGPRGNRVPPGRIFMGRISSTVTRWPDSPNLVFCVHQENQIEGFEDEGHCQLVSVDPNGKLLIVGELHGSIPDHHVDAATDHSCGRIYIVTTHATDTWLAILEQRNGELEVVDEGPVPERLRLYTNTQGQRVIAAWQGEEGLTMRDLVDGLPGEAGRAILPRIPLMEFGADGIESWTFDGPGRAHSSALAAQLEEISSAGIDSWLDRYLGREWKDLPALMALRSALYASPHGLRWKALERRLLEEEGPFRDLRQLRLLVEAGDYIGVRRLLDQKGEDLAFPTKARVAILALLGTGALDEARALLAQIGEEIEAEHLTELLDALESSPGEEPTSPLGIWVADMRSVDRAIEAQRWPEVVDSLDQPEWWGLSDAQTAGRRALAWLNLQVHEPAERFAMRRALARYLYILDESAFSVHLPLGAQTWSPERVAEVKRQALERLEVEGAG